MPSLSEKRSWGTALVSKVLGEGDEEKANRYFSMMIWLTLILGAVFSAAGLIFMRPVAVFLGATPLLFGVDGIWWAITVAELCACILSALFLVWNRKRYNYW